MKLIDVENVSFQYKESQKWALHDLNLSIEEGEFVSIIGANGSGKSTLAKLMNVLLQPTEGRVFVKGLDTLRDENIQKIRRQTGMVFQNPDNQLVATMVEDDVAFGLENLGIPSGQIRKRVDRALKMVNMDGFQLYSPDKLSGGQKQKVAIAGIIAMEPSCIVLDEPTAMLDPMGRKEVIKIIKYLNQEKNITVILITHLMEEACQADRVFVMSEGRIVNQGSPLQAFSEIELLKKIGLDVPLVMELVSELRKKGLSLPDVLSIDELVNVLC